MRVLVTCVLSFVLAMLVGMLVLPGTAPRHKPSTHTSKPLKRQAQDPPLEMLPALPSLRAARTDAPSDQSPAARPARQVLKTRQYRVAGSASSTSAIRAHPPTVLPRGHTRKNPAPAIREHVPNITSDQRPGPAPHTEIAATIPASGASQPPQVSAPPPTPNVTPPTPNVTLTNPSPRVPDAYVLGPGDQIEVNVPHLAVTVTIDPDGVIALPLISPVKAAGKTTAQLASDLMALYSRVLDAPAVTVFVRQYRLNR